MNLESDKRLNIQLRLDFSSAPTGEARQALREDIESLSVVHESERQVQLLAKVLNDEIDLIVSHDRLFLLPFCYPLSGWADTVNSNVAPRGTFALAHRRPLCASMIERQIDSPSPKPPGFVVWKASNTRAKAAGAKPGPESRTSTDTPSGSFRVLLSNYRSSSPTSRIPSMALMIKFSRT